MSTTLSSRGLASRVEPITKLSTSESDFDCGGALALCAASAASASFSTPGSEVTPPQSSAVRNRMPCTPSSFRNLSRLMRTSASIRSPAARSRSSPRRPTARRMVAAMTPLPSSSASAAHNSPSKSPSSVPPDTSTMLRTKSTKPGSGDTSAACSAEPAAPPPAVPTTALTTAPWATANGEGEGGGGGGGGAAHCGTRRRRTGASHCKGTRRRPADRTPVRSAASAVQRRSSASRRMSQPQPSKRRVPASKLG
eukprot:7387457-Prymnesium_polylepis.2